MSEYRKKARASIAEAESAIDAIPQALTLLSIGKIVVALLAVLKAVRDTVEWLDASEFG